MTLETADPSHDDTTEASEDLNNDVETRPDNMRLRVAVKALLGSATSDDPEVRSGACQSLSKLGQFHPLTLLTEWLSLFNDEREHCRQAQNQKKKSNEDDSSIKIKFLVECLKVKIVIIVFSLLKLLFSSP